MNTKKQFYYAADDFIKANVQAGLLSPLSGVRVINGPDETELLGYEVTLVRDRPPTPTNDQLGINADDPLETEFVEMSRHYGKLQFTDGKMVGNRYVQRYFVDPKARTFYLYREVFSGKPREYIVGVPQGSDLAETIMAADWSEDRERATRFSGLEYSLVKCVLDALKASNSAERFRFGREYLKD